MIVFVNFFYSYALEVCEHHEPKQDFLFAENLKSIFLLCTNLVCSVFLSNAIIFGTEFQIPLYHHRGKNSMMCV